MGQIKQSGGWKKDCAINIEEKPEESRRQGSCAASEKKKQKWINYKLPGVSIPRGVIIIKKSKRKKSYFWIACSSAFASWSGHDVPRPLQSMPFMREMASFTSMPSTSLATPCVFPLHPPTNCTLCTLPSSTSNRIFSGTGTFCCIFHR